MTTPLPSSSPHAGRFTGLVMGMVVFVCLTMIGFSGYLKYQLDRAETTLAAPDSAPGADQEATEKLRRSLGYGGFLGLAQNYVTAHDSGTLSDMKAQIKIADDMMAELPEKTSAEVRHDLQSIVATFDMVMQKATKSSMDPATTLTNNDLVPLYGALPVLDQRLSSAAASNRADAHNHLQFWAMLLTLICWSSLIIAAAMSVGIYLSLRDRNSAPMRALAQSIKNMASGDMRTSIWGMERSDMVGELARAVDLARYQFSQLPDMSVLSEQGPLRLRFEGKAQTLFEGMMQGIARDSEHVRNQATSLTDAITRQQEAITLISSRVEAVLHTVEKRGMDGDHQVKHVVQSLTSSAVALKNAQEHSTDQLNRLIPYLQERAQGMAEIAQITGKQIAQTLQSMTVTERGLKTSAEQSDSAIKKISTTADDLGSRLFGAINLLQASGKVLAETTEKTQSRLNEALEKLDQNIASVDPAAQKTDASSKELLLIPRIEHIVQSFEGMQQRLEERLSQEHETPHTDHIIQAFEGAQQRLEERLAQQNQAAEAHVHLLTEQSNSLLSQTTTTAQILSSASDTLRAEQDRLQTMLDHLATKINVLSQRMDEQAAPSAHPLSTPPSAELHALSQQITQIGEAIASLRTTSDISFQMAALPEQILNGIKESLTTVDRGLTTLPAQILSSLKEDLSTTDRGMEQLRTQLADIGRHITQASTQPGIDEIIKQRLDATTHLIEQLRSDILSLTHSNVSRMETQPSAQLVKEVEARWFQMAAQIEASRADLAQAITQQVDRIETRLSKSSTVNGAHEPEAARDTQRQIEQQTQILTELVATLGVLDAHMQQLKSEMRVAR